MSFLRKLSSLKTNRLQLKKPVKSNLVKKALIITYYWPPSGGAGVQRWLKFAKYLREFGWEPIIYTPENPEIPVRDDSLLTDIPENLEIIRTSILEPYSFYKRLIGMDKGEKINSGFISEKKKPGLAESVSVWIRGNLFIPDARMFWIRPSVRFLLKYLNEHPVDVVITTGPPHSLHLIGMRLKEKLSIRWLADFRDPWTGIYYYDQLKLSKAADRRHRKLEESVLSKADMVTVVGDHMKEEFSGIVNREYLVIPNGYDADDFKPVHDEMTRNRFSIAHFGTIYPLANPEIFWKVLSGKVKADDAFAENLEIKLVGKADHSVMSSISDAGLDRFVKKIGYLPHNEVVTEMERSQILLLLVNKTPQAKGILTGKLFEYLAARRPVICLGPPDGDAANLIISSNAGLNADYDDEKGIKYIIDRYFNQFLQGKLICESNNIEQFSRRELTRKMAGILDILTI
jgi:glycosyltransferase involved in cell wall biosynthesis